MHQPLRSPFRLLFCSLFISVSLLQCKKADDTPVTTTPTPQPSAQIKPGERPYHQFTWIRLLCLLLLIGVSACTKGPADDVVPTGAAFYSKCQFDNVACYGKESVGTQVVYKTTGKPTYQFILVMKVGNDSAKDLWVVISLNNFTGKGKYDLSTSNSELYTVVRSGATDYESTTHSGTFEVTDYQPRKLVAGTFSLNTSNGNRTSSLKDGEFRSESDF